jgi:hypothetical protein
MKRLPTKFAEKVYDLLCKFAEANSNYYEREAFIYHYGVLSDKSSQYTLNCMDDSKRIFNCSLNGRMWVDGVNTGKINKILNKVAEEISFESNEVQHSA